MIEADRGNSLDSIVAPPETSSQLVLVQAPSSRNQHGSSYRENILEEPTGGSAVLADCTLSYPEADIGGPYGSGGSQHGAHELLPRTCDGHSCKRTRGYPSE